MTDDQRPSRVAYIRVSTEEQADEGYGLAAQKEALRRAFEYYGWRQVELIADEGLTGSTLSRPGLRRALELLAGGEADGLVVAKLDRLTRSVVDFSDVLDWFIAADAVFVALDLNVDTGTATGRLVAQVLAVVSEWERSVIAERTSAGMAAKRATGQAISRPAVGDRPELSDRIRAMRTSGMKLQEIADALTAEGVPTPRGAKAWGVSSLQTALGYRRRRRRRRVELPPIPRRPSRGG